MSAAVERILTDCVGRGVDGGETDSSSAAKKRFKLSIGGTDFDAKFKRPWVNLIIFIIILLTIFCKLYLFIAMQQILLTL